MDSGGGEIGAGRGNRTPVCSLEGCRSTIELHPLLPANRSELRAGNDLSISPAEALSNPLGAGAGDREQRVGEPGCLGINSDGRQALPAGSIN